jgi:hypothetical protein
MSFNVYSRKSCYAPDEDRVFLTSFSTMKEAWNFMKEHYKTITKEETIYYVRTLLIHENEHLYDLGSHVQFYSIENTEGEMSLYWKDEEIELP